jgi:branched-chain amino acid transport system substrate-binding protein
MAKKSRIAVGLTVVCLLAAACTGAKRPISTDVAAGGATTTTALAGVDGTALGGPGAANAAPGAVPGATAPGAAAAAPGAKAGAGAPKAATGTPAGATATTARAGAAPGAPVTTLFNADEDRVGITKDKITLCAHAALTYAPAFHTDTADLKVYFDAINAEQNGIFGRKVEITYENDDYKPDTAVQAANTCKGKNPFMLLGGIGFDQIPAVRNWAESNRMLYLTHTATVNGTAGKQFSFSELPSTERMGEVFGELAATKFKGKTIGIIKRDSPNWEPGVEAFKAVAAKHGVKIVAERAVAASKGNYIDDIVAVKGADVVWTWENALASTEIIKQAKAQNFSPDWMVFPFNLTSQTLGDDALNPKLSGVAMYTAYSFGDYSGTFAPYSDDMKEFERQYKQYDPNVDLTSLGGDLLFLNWTAMKVLHKQLLDCGPDCTRNKFIDVMKSYKKTPISSACQIDMLRGNGHLGGWAVNIMETYKSPDGHVNWRNTHSCVEHVL